MGVSIAVVAIATTTLLALSFSEGQSQGVTCFSEISCSGSSSSSSDFEACCLSTGYSYESGGSCKNCTVIGWKIASKPDGSINTAISFELEENNNIYEFVVGCLKGYIGRATFNVEPQNTEDFSTSNKVFTMVRCKEQTVDLSLQVDHRAMEPNEEFTLSLVRQGTIDAIIVNEIDITIIDSDVVNLGFNEADRVIKEGDGLLNIKVVQKDPIMTFDSNVTVQLIPVDYKYATDNDIVSPSRYSYDPDTPNRAKGGLDYNTSPITITFLGDMREVEVNGDVEIIDDSVDEVRQFFFVILKVLNATNTDRINLTSRYIECNIDDNDDTFLSFELSYYAFPEILIGTGDYQINIIKDKQSSTTETENKYEFTVQVKSLDKATKDVDFTASSKSQTISANEVRTSYSVNIIDDIIPEGNESFLLSISPVPNKPQWRNGRSFTTTVTIIDNDALPVFGFVETNVTIAEDVGTYPLIVTLFDPESINLFGTFDFDVLSVEDSASEGSDYKKIVDYLENIKYPTINRTVTVSVREDLQLEDDEIFYLTLKHLPGSQDNSILDPSVANFTIVDNDRARVGLEMINYTFDENSGVVMICASVFEPNIDCPISFSFDISFDISNGTAVTPEDYLEPSTVSKVFHFNRCANKSCINLSIEDDDIPEGTENFNVRIGRTPNLSSRIDLQPDQAGVFIIDNDPIAVGYEQTMYNTTEGQRSVVLVAVISFPAPRPFTIAASTSSGTAGGGLDYTPVTMQPLVFNIGDTRKSHTITILDDTVCERTPNEHFFSDLFQVRGLVTIDPMRATVLINDFDETECDPIIVGYDKTVYTTTEGQGSVVLVVVVISPETGASRAFTIAAYTSNGTAGDFDYNSTVMPQLVFEKGDKNQSHTIPIHNDTVCESNPNEQFSSNLVYVSGLRPIMIDPMRATATVIIDDTNEPECGVIIDFESVPPRVLESVGMAVVTIRIRGQLSGKTVTVQIFTMDGSANSGTDYTETVQNVTFMDGQVGNMDIQIIIVNDNIIESDENFKVGLSLISPVPNVRVDQTMRSIQIIDDDKPTVSVNDTLTGDPLLTVPILTDTVNNIQTSLCYEIHGKADTFFNLISDSWVSVNANYTKAVAIGGSSSTVPDVNVVNSIGVRALSSKGCHNIGVDLNGCQATVDNIIVSTTTKLNGISIRKFNNRVRIAIPKPKPGQSTLVMWIFCMDGSIGDFHFHMMRLLVTRGVGLDITSHGLIGQFWNVPVSVTAYDGNFAGSQRSDDYLIRVPYPRSQERSFVGILGDKTWEFEKRPCLYVGNSQGGPIDEVDKDGPNDSVIEGEYTQYEVAGLFSTLFTYGRFNESSCM